MTLTYKVIFVCIILYLIYRNSFKELFTDYYKCDKYRLNKPLQNLIDTHNINKNSDINKSELYIPCTYTTSEIELAENVFNKDQSIFAVAGCDSIVSKNYLWHILISNLGRDEASKIMPETFLIDDKNDMDLFVTKYRNFVAIIRNLGIPNRYFQRVGGWSGMGRGAGIPRYTKSQ